VTAAGTVHLAPGGVGGVIFGVKVFITIANRLLRSALLVVRILTGFRSLSLVIVGVSYGGGRGCPEGLLQAVKGSFELLQDTKKMQVSFIS
jgi:hypothetical protein